MVSEGPPEAGSLAAYIVRASAEEMQYAMDKRRISSTPSATGDIAHDEPRQRAGSPSAATATADGDYVHRSNGSHALPFADAGLKGAGHIFLTKYGRGRSTSDVSKSPSKHSPGGHQTFYVVRSPPDPQWPRAAAP